MIPDLQKARKHRICIAQHRLLVFPSLEHVPSGRSLPEVRYDLGLDEPEGGPSIRIASWNLMAHCRCGKTGRPGTALAGEVLSNNGFDLDESLAQYEERLSAHVAPHVTDDRVVRGPSDNLVFISRRNR